MSLLWNSQNNTTVLNDKKISKADKEKIRLIIKYKKYFYTYFSLKSTDIYTQTTFLKQKPVSYLVIRSKFNKVYSEQECFPFVGCFPYLGFFSLNSAKEYQKIWDKQNYYTYLREVYAYSTLGNFEDRILSSFFFFDDYDLAELIFHELFHTIYFIKNEVSLNENLANFFGKTLTKIYFSKNSKLLQSKKLLKVKNRKMANLVTSLVAKYKVNLKNNSPQNKESADLLLSEFKNRVFFPRISKFCLKHNIKKCYPLKQEWNNARFAAVSTYEMKQKRIIELFKSNESNLVFFYKYLESSFKKYKTSKKNVRFPIYLLGE